MYVRKYDGIINQYVPNRHVADKFKDCLLSIDLESIYEGEYGNIKNVHNNITSIGNNNDPNDYERKEDGSYSKTYYTNRKMIDYMDDYFNLSRLKKDGVNEIIRTYNKLREKEDIARNTMMLQQIELPHEFSYKPNSKYYKLKTTDL